MNVDKKPVTIHGAPKGYLSLSASKYYLDAIGVGIKFNDENGYADLGYTLYRWWTGL